MVQDSLSSLTLIWYVVGGSLWYSCHGIADVCECLPAFMPQIGILEVVAELCGCGSDRSVIHGSPLVDLCKDVAMKNMFVLYQVGGKDLLDGIFAKLLDYESWKVPFFFGQIWFTHGILGQRFMPCNFMIWGWRASFFLYHQAYVIFLLELIGRTPQEMIYTNQWTMNPTRSCWLSLMRYNFFQVWVPPKLPKRTCRNYDEDNDFLDISHFTQGPSRTFSNRSPIGWILFDRFSHHVYSHWCFFWEVHLLNHEARGQNFLYDHFFFGLWSGESEIFNRRNVEM